LNHWEVTASALGLALIGARSALIRMGAAAVGALAGIPVRFVASWNEVAGALGSVSDHRR
jgi:hypothetical protein